MTFDEPTTWAAWRHRDARDGFEAVFVGSDESGRRLEGHTTAVEDGQPWTVGYVVMLDPDWVTRTATIWSRSLLGEQRTTLEVTDGRWVVDGVPRPELDGCVDIDLESSACTNTLPVHRLRLAVGAEASVPAAYVRAIGVAVQRLEQRYRRLDDDGDVERYDYESSTFDFRCELRYDRTGLVLDYPGIATRAR